jgi:hypothetical protein
MKDVKQVKIMKDDCQTSDERRVESHGRVA